MTSRLPVVISQNPQRSGQTSELEEQLVADLIFANGLDVSLIDSFERVAVGSTDHLCLEGLLGDFAVLCWAPIDNTAAELARLNISGRMAVTGLRADTKGLTIGKSNVSRRIYHYDLHQLDSAQTMVTELRRLLDDRNQKIIGLSISPRRPGPEAESKDSPVKPVPLTRVLQIPTVEAQPTTQSPISNPDAIAPIIPITFQTTSMNRQDALDHEEEWDHLDRLVDDLDEAKL